MIHIVRIVQILLLHKHLYLYYHLYCIAICVILKSSCFVCLPRVGRLGAYGAPTRNQEYYNIMLWYVLACVSLHAEKQHWHGRRSQEAVSNNTGIRLDVGRPRIFFFAQLQKQLCRALAKRKRRTKREMHRQPICIIRSPEQARELKAMRAEDRHRHILD